MFNFEIDNAGSRHMLSCLLDTVQRWTLGKRHGMSDDCIQEVFHSFVLAKLLYASPAWSGFCSTNDVKKQGDHSPDNVKFPDDSLTFPEGSWHSSTALSMLSVTHIMPVLVSVVGVGMQQYMIQNHILNI